METDSGRLVLKFVSHSLLTFYQYNTPNIVQGIFYDKLTSDRFGNCEAQHFYHKKLLSLHGVKEKQKFLSGTKWGSAYFLNRYISYCG